MRLRDPMHQMHSVFFRVSSDFFYTNNITPSTYSKTPLINKESLPWYSSGDESELDMTFHNKDGPIHNHSNIFQPLDGLLVFIHSPNEFLTQPSNHFYQRFYTSRDITITPEITLIADELKFWPAKKRNCLLAGEKKLKYFRIYTRNNCEDECLSKAVHETCGCVPFHLIRKFEI